MDVVPLECSSVKVKVLKTVVTESYQAQIAVENKLQEVQAHLNQANKQVECFKILHLEWQNVQHSKDCLLKVLCKVNQLNEMGKEQPGKLAYAQHEPYANKQK